MQLSVVGWNYAGCCDTAYAQALSFVSSHFADVRVEGDRRAAGRRPHFINVIGEVLGCICVLHSSHRSVGILDIIIWRSCDDSFCDVAFLPRSTAHLLVGFHIMQTAGRRRPVSRSTGATKVFSLRCMRITAYSRRHIA